ncbi:MAG: hypothetical protein A2Y10_00570 [Planctomycetes bacterium GWF2_41_51]|nr:MAG: hypothetical protein A2Y10_00570 [Planctomycetes bacterium GWF2_41_51]HBG26894.1 hypothetical protein [Phycisphaerales bacterium]
MTKEFPLESVSVETIETKYRKISGRIPNDKTIEQIKQLREFEARSMRDQLLIVWDKAQGNNVFDAYGNKWLDLSSGVLITNAGHSHPQIVKAIINQASKSLLTTYCFPNQPRIDLVQKLIEISPKKLNKVFLVSTGAETTECALKLMRTYGKKVRSDSKKYYSCICRCFSWQNTRFTADGCTGTGRVWINLDPEIVHVPFPDGFRNENISFDLFTETFSKLKINPDHVAGVISETYQGIARILCRKNMRRNFASVRYL